MKYTPALWAIAGAAVAAIVIPTAATAVASQLVTVVDATTGSRAAVDTGHRLQVAETSPANMRTIVANGVSITCRSVFNVPVGRTLVITNVYATPEDNGGLNAAVDVYANGTCTGNSLAEGTVFESGGSVDDVAIDLGAGATVAAGRSVSVVSDNYVNIHIYGYLV